MANAFTTNGPTPKLTSSLTGSTPPYVPQGSTTPKGNALSRFKDSVYNHTIGAANKGLDNAWNGLVNAQTKAQGNSYAGKATNAIANTLFGQPHGTGAPFTPVNHGTQPSAGLLPPKTQDIKSHTSADGTTQTYYPSSNTKTSASVSTPSKDQGTPAPSSSQPAVGSMQYDSQHNLPSGTSSQQGYQVTPNSPNQSIPSAQNYPSYVSSLANQQNSPANLAAQKYTGLIGDTAGGNQALGKNAQDIARTAGQRISEIGQQGAAGQAGYRTTGTSPVAQGRSAVVAQTTAAQQQAVAQGAQTELQGNAQALTAQGQQQSGYTSAAGQALGQQGQAQGALGTAAGLAAPDANTAYYGDPLSGGLYGGAGNGGQTGRTGNQLIDGSVDKVMQLIQAGTPPQQAMAYLVGGDVARQALLTRMGSGGGLPNIAALDTSANQNLAYGQQVQAQAQQLSQGLESLKPLQAQAIDFLSLSGLNKTGSPLFDKPINEYLNNFASPENAVKWASIKNDFTAYANQILSAKNAANLPTTKDEIAAAQDPSLLSPRALQGVFQAWDTLGQTNLKVLRDLQSGAYGGVNGYTGPTGTGMAGQAIQGGTQYTGFGSGNTNPLQQGITGAVLQSGQAIGGIPTAVTGIGAGLLKLLI